MSEPVYVWVVSAGTSDDAEIIGVYRTEERAAQERNKLIDKHWSPGSRYGVGVDKRILE